MKLMLERLLFRLLLRGDPEEFAGVRAFHFGADGEARDIDQLMLLSVRTVNEAWAAIDGGAERQFWGCCGCGFWRRWWRGLRF